MLKTAARLEFQRWRNWLYFAIMKYNMIYTVYKDDKIFYLKKLAESVLISGDEGEGDFQLQFICIFLSCFPLQIYM